MPKAQERNRSVRWLPRRCALFCLIRDKRKGLVGEEVSKCGGRGMRSPGLMLKEQQRGQEEWFRNPSKTCVEWGRESIKSVVAVDKPRRGCCLARRADGGV